MILEIEMGISHSSAWHIMDIFHFGNLAKGIGYARRISRKLSCARIGQILSLPGDHRS